MLFSPILEALSLSIIVVVFLLLLSPLLGGSKNSYRDRLSMLEAFSLSFIVVVLFLLLPPFKR